MRRFLGKLGLRLIRYAALDSNLVRHAVHEWAIAFPEKDEMQDAVGLSVMDTCAVFSLHGHSGGSAPYTIGFIEKALRYQVFSKLTGADNEWTEIDRDDDLSPIFQNKRDGRVFKVGYRGAPYMIDGRIFQELDGSCYTSSKSHVDMPPFPCYPPEPIIIPVDEDGNELLDLTDAMTRIGEYEIADTKDGEIAITWDCGDGIAVDKIITVEEFNGILHGVFEDKE